MTLTIILPRFLIIPANEIVDIAYSSLQYARSEPQRSVVKNIVNFSEFDPCDFYKKKMSGVQNISSVTIEDFSLISET